MKGYVFQAEEGPERGSKEKTMELEHVSMAAVWEFSKQSRPFGQSVSPV